MKDEIFKKPIKKQFEFDESVASVFDDMLVRSVPFYKEVIDLISDLIVKNLSSNDTVTDLGCSTAQTLLEIYKKSDKNLTLIGIDNSEAMLKRAKNKAKAYGAKIDLILGDILKESIPKSKAIISNYTLQFIRPLKREKLVKKIFNSLEEEGFFIVSEKVISEDKVLNLQLIEEYYEFKKKKGYSDFEIAQKREALENVLVPYSDKENMEMFKNAGFSYIEIIFKWANFSTYFVKKSAS
ncbi:MAG: carboxy-S-adenosyl-L-methionine synthase CmoA [Epsilonproteobacteria bacterium]|nr:carboxy-S-adenosyl-L-methionine synthase CmoA [Campylobacterota bacterium]